MLSRRVLRIKTMQAIYAFMQGDTDNMDAAEKNLLKSIAQIQDLLIYQFSVLLELRDYAEKAAEVAMKKHLPTAEDLNPNKKFINNRVARILDKNKTFQKYYDNLKINWSGQSDLIKKIFNEIKNSREYGLYLNSPDDDYKHDISFISLVYELFMIEREEFQTLYEEQNLHWANDFDIANYLIVKSLKGMKEDYSEEVPFFSLFSSTNFTEDNEDKEFVLTLFRKTILHNPEYNKMIEKKLENWEFDRIALMDIILINMALCEILEFPTIPIKVSLNEYIEISKIYSTPKSSIFVNGILDKIAKYLKDNNKVKKTGRGLIE